MTFDDICNAVEAERARQDARWGTGFVGRSDAYWLAILAEEFGEVANAILEQDEGNIEVELVQVAAVVFWWLEFRTSSNSQPARFAERGFARPPKEAVL